MRKLFRQVSLNYKEPDKDGWYFTDNGSMEYNAEHKAFGYYEETYPGGPDAFIEVSIDWWLEELSESPDVEELDQAAETYAKKVLGKDYNPHNLASTALSAGYVDGFNAAISALI